MDKYRIGIKESVLSLSDINKLLFAILTCERLYPNYIYFQQKTNWGNNEILQEAIILLYQSVFNKNSIKMEDILEAISRVDSITPETEEFPGMATSFALDACTSVYSTLHYLIDNDAENIVDVAIFARDTVDMFIQEKDDMDYNNDPDFESKIANNPFMIAEKNRQKELISTLKTMGNITMETSIDSLRITTPIIDVSQLP